MRKAIVLAGLLLLAGATSGCFFSSPEPISAKEAYLRAEEALREGREPSRFAERTFVGLVGIEGQVEGEQAKALFGGNDAFSLAFAGLLLDASFRDQHPDGKRGDGLLGEWAVIYLVEEGASGDTLVIVHVASGNGGAGMSIMGPVGPGGADYPIGDLNDCDAGPAPTWKVSGGEAVKAARSNASFAAVADDDAADFLYSYASDEGFIDGCNDTSTPLWSITSVDLDRAAAGLETQTAIAIIDAVTGNVLEAETTLMIAPVGPTRVTLLDAQKTFTNPVPCDLSCGTAGDDPEVGRFTLENEASDVFANFTLVGSGQTVFADNCRLWRGEGETDLVEQAAFNGGTCKLRLASLDPGLYRAVFMTDELDPTGSHEVSVLATGVL